MHEMSFLVNYNQLFKYRYVCLVNLPTLKARDGRGTVRMTTCTSDADCFSCPHPVCVVPDCSVICEALESHEPAHKGVKQIQFGLLRVSSAGGQQCVICLKKKKKKNCSSLQLYLSRYFCSTKTVK